MGSLTVFVMVEILQDERRRHKLLHSTIIPWDFREIARRAAIGKRQVHKIDYLLSAV